MKKAIGNCIDQGEYYDEVDTDDGFGFKFTPEAEAYISEIGARAGLLCGMLGKEYKIDD
jgi:hypothetical protein